MIDRRTCLEHYWTPPHMLSKREFLEITDYVALRKSNYQTCSEKLVRSLLTTRELFESAMKAIYDFASKRPSFPDYAEKLDGDALFDRSCRITVERGYESIELAPFAKMPKEKAPEWWSARNKVKHDGIQEFPQGNLENALNALAALYYVHLILASTSATTGMNNSHTKMKTRATSPTISRDSSPLTHLKRSIAWRDTRCISRQKNRTSRSIQITQTLGSFATPIQCCIGELLKPEISNDETVAELKRFQATDYPKPKRSVKRMPVDDRGHL